MTMSSHSKACIFKGHVLRHPHSAPHNCCTGILYNCNTLCYTVWVVLGGCVVCSPTLGVLQAKLPGYFDMHQSLQLQCRHVQSAWGMFPSACLGSRDPDSILLCQRQPAMGRLLCRGTASGGWQRFSGTQCLLHPLASLDTNFTSLCLQMAAPSRAAGRADTLLPASSHTRL